MNESAIAKDTFEVFGTTAVLLVTDPRAIAQARSAADQVLAEVDRAGSRFRTDSELVRLNAADGEPLAISATFADLLATALRAAALTGGDVDPTCGRALAGLGYDRDFADVKAAGDAAPRLTGPVGPLPGWRSVHLDHDRRRAWLEHGAQIDLGATAKAWAADRCAAQLAHALDCGVLVSLGGDVSVAGPPPPEHWRIRVADDHAAPKSAPGQTVTISSGGLATSSTTVRTWTVGGTCTDANIASTAAIIRGAAALAWLHDLGLPARLVRHDGSVETTAGWPSDVPGDAA
jgi:thiamine biosynthesis lipoprotein